MCFGANFWAKRKLCTAFFTSLGFLTIRANLKENGGYAECFDANFKQQDNCARSFANVKKRHQFELTGQLRTQSPTGFSFLTIPPNLEQNNSCAVWLGANFEQPESCAWRFSQALASLKYGPIWSKTTVAGSVWTPISSSRKVAHGVFDKSSPYNKRHQFWLTGQLCTDFLIGFSFLTKRPNLKQNESCAVWLGVNFEQQHGCARCFRQVVPF